MDFEKIGLSEQIKRIANYRGLNMNHLREEYNKKNFERRNFYEQDTSAEIGAR